MTAWGVRVEIPLKELGRVRLPRYRIRYKDGWVRLGYTPTGDRVVATLEDREGRAQPAPTQVEACAKAALMGRVIAYHLMKYNRYEPGEDAGDREKILVAFRSTKSLGEIKNASTIWNNSMAHPKNFDARRLQKAVA